MVTGERAKNRLAFVIFPISRTATCEPLHLFLSIGPAETLQFGNLPRKRTLRHKSGIMSYHVLGESPVDENDPDERREDGWRSHAQRPHMDGGLQYHIRCRPGDVARYVLLPGDPARVPVLASHWDESRKVSEHREYVTYSGKAGGVPVSACSTGIGGPSTSIALEELAEIGADTFIRVGTTGAIRPDIRCGHLIIATGAMRLDGTSDDYVPPSYPALASYEVVAALIEAAEQAGVPYHVGVSASTASFHCGQGRPGYGGYLTSPMKERFESVRASGVLNFEMESATLFCLAGLFGLRSGAVFAVVANRETDEFEYTGIPDVARVAVLGVRILAEWDAARERAGKKHWFPSIIAGTVNSADL